MAVAFVSQPAVTSPVQWSLLVGHWVIVQPPFTQANSVLGWLGVSVKATSTPPSQSSSFPLQISLAVGCTALAPVPVSWQSPPESTQPVAAGALHASVLLASVPNASLSLSS